MAPRLTVAAVIEREGRFLLVEERIRGVLVLNQPAGHVEARETPVAAVVREVLEETACDFQPGAIVGLYTWHNARTGASLLRIAFCGTCSDPDPGRELDEDIERTVWQRPEQIASARCRSPLVQRCIADFRAGQRYPLELSAEVGVPR